MKVLVTGATSGLGRNAVEFLCQKGISVRATGRNEAMGKLLEKMGAEFVPADLTELVSSQAKVMLAGIDTLWHCSSFTSPWGTQQAFDLANVRATRRLGEWAVAWGVRNFIHISSPPCTSIITTIAILKKIFALTASPTSLPAAKQPAKR
ncbi:nucleotide di-P-sugar epimerase or dehydratase [Escherichia coli]|uniref:Nucleotide di-P-sugar epimerase or dehydratase n=1 Tax=Escherichia coli TaxID=562 RepID=A0A447XCK7_ECOLX|nr:nucleotide di-P-sugar epimerase or dehydratase [Escherichia coli]